MKSCWDDFALEVGWERHKKLQIKTDERLVSLLGNRQVGY